MDFAFEKIQCFPFYTYNEDGTNRRENITDWALAAFRKAYGDTKYEIRDTSEESALNSSLVTQHSSLDKWAIFHYIYALLHHPAYRETYAANLRRELPRIPFVRDFWAYARAGARLAELHVHYEQQPEYPLARVENPDEPLDWRVEKMRLSKDKTQLRYNDFLTLGGIPAAAFDYRLGNRSALEWVIDQYRVTTDKRSGITNDPNRADDPQYIVRLIGQVVAVSIWAEWCPFCKVEEGSLTNVSQDWPVLHLIHRSGNEAQVQRLLQQRQLPWTTMTDAHGRLAQALGLLW